MTDPALIEGLGKAATASIADAPDRLVGRRCSMDHAIRPRTDAREAEQAKPILAAKKLRERLAKYGRI